MTTKITYQGKELSSTFDGNRGSHTRNYPRATTCRFEAVLRYAFVGGGDNGRDD